MGATPHATSACPTQQIPPFALIGISAPRSWAGQLDVIVLYGQCKTHKACKYRFRAVFDKSERKCTVSGHGEHSEEQALCRQDARLPTTRVVQSKVKDILETSRSGRVTATEVTERVMTERPDEDAPVGRAIQNMVKKARYRAPRTTTPLRVGGIKRGVAKRAPAHSQKSQSPASVQNLLHFCAMRKLDLDVDASLDAVDQTELSVVHVTLAGGSFPVVTASLVVVPYTAWKLVLHACHVLGPTNVRKSFVAQSDFMFKVCWQGYALGAFGIQVWRLTERRSRDPHSTDIMTPWPHCPIAL